MLFVLDTITRSPALFESRVHSLQPVLNSTLRLPGRVPRAMKLTITLLLQVAVLSACAGPQFPGPQLQIPRASSQDVDAERRRQLALIQDKQDVAFRKRIEKWRRVFAVYSRLRTARGEL